MALITRQHRHVVVFVVVHQADRAKCLRIKIIVIISSEHLTEPYLLKLVNNASGGGHPVMIIPPLASAPEIQEYRHYQQECYKHQGEYHELEVAVD